MFSRIFEIPKIFKNILSFKKENNEQAFSGSDARILGGLSFNIAAQDRNASNAKYYTVACVEDYLIPQSYKKAIEEDHLCNLTLADQGPSKTNTLAILCQDGSYAPLEGIDEYPTLLQGDADLTPEDIEINCFINFANSQCEAIEHESRTRTMEVIGILLAVVALLYGAKKAYNCIKARRERPHDISLPPLNSVNHVTQFRAAPAQQQNLPDLNRPLLMENDERNAYTI